MPQRQAVSQDLTPKPKDLAAITVTVMAMVRVMILRGTKPTAPGTLGMKIVFQEEHSTAPTFLPRHLSHLGHHACGDLSSSHWVQLGQG